MRTIVRTTNIVGETSQFPQKLQDASVYMNFKQGNDDFILFANAAHLVMFACAIQWNL